MNPDVLVVGAGPVGLTMAAELVRYGVAVRIIDKAAGRTDKSKAIVLWSRSLELIDRMGCGAAFVAAGMKATASNVIAGGRRIAHIRLDTVETPHPYALMLPQSETERLLEHQLNAYGVRVERQVELAGFTAERDRVTAVLRDANRDEERLDTAWLIGCDGAHSSVRHGLGVQFEGETLPSNWILADVHLAGVRTPPGELDMYWHSDGVLALFPIAGDRYRVIADVDDDMPAGGGQGDPTLAEVQALIDRRGPGGIEASAPIWLAGFVINERKVADYRVGRVFLAGDAAHIHSPAGGQGMNTGIQDACNLGWKLAMVCRGLTRPEPLLDSYSIERSEVGRQVLANAGHLTTLATLKGGVLQGLRNHVAALVFGLSPVRRAMTNTLAELSIGYPHSPLTEAGGHACSGPAAGERAPLLDADHPVGSGDTPRFALFAPDDPAGAALIVRHRDLLEPETRPPFAQDGVWLVRPDGYVGITAARGEWDKISAYVDRLASR
jgi:2-polyprenyl-6-methoxyphenol hydroxylase-like FAD-dependent oxidoreductase